MSNPPQTTDDVLVDPCPRCGSTALGTFESIAVHYSGATEYYLVCEDCGYEVRRLQGNGSVL